MKQSLLKDVDDSAPKFKTKQQEIQYLRGKLKESDDTIESVLGLQEELKKAHIANIASKVDQCKKDCFVSFMTDLENKISEIESQIKDQDNSKVSDARGEMEFLKDLRNWFIYRELTRQPGYKFEGEPIGIIY